MNLPPNNEIVGAGLDGIARSCRPLLVLGRLAFLTYAGGDNEQFRLRKGASNIGNLLSRRNDAIASGIKCELCAPKDNLLDSFLRTNFVQVTLLHMS